MTTVTAPATTSTPLRFASKVRATSTASGGLSATIGAALLVTVVFVNDAVFRVADAEQATFDLQVAVRLVVCGLCGLYGLAHLRSALRTLTRGPALLVTAFACWSTLLVPFSINPGFSAYAMVSLWCVLLFTAAVRNEVAPLSILKSIVISLLVFLVASWLLWYVIPPLGQEVQNVGDGVEVTRFGGLQHPNGLGRQCALTVAMLLVVGLDHVGRWRRLVIPIVFTVFTGVWTESRTAILVMAALIAAAACCRLPKRKLALAGVMIIPLTAAFFGMGLSTGIVEVKVDRMAEKLSRDGDANEVYSLNSRTQVWDFAMDRFWRSPLIGYGQGCQRFVMKDNFFPTHHAHNILLNVALGTGVIGAGLLLWQAIVLARRCLVRPSAFTGLFLLSVLLFGMTDSVMLGSMPDSHTILWWLALFLPAGLSDWSTRPLGHAEEFA